MRTLLLTIVAIAAVPPRMAMAQDPDAATRTALIEREQAAKVPTLHPYVPNRGEKYAQKIQDIIAGGGLRWHPFFQSAYAGGGFTLGAGYARYVSPYNFIDMRGSYTVSGYKRAEAELVAPRLFTRRGVLSVLGGWREATQIGFYGIGNNTAVEHRVNYAFRQPYLTSRLTIRPTRRAVAFGGGFEWSRWDQQPGQGAFPSVQTQYAPATLPGLGATVAYAHTQASIGVDTRTSPGYSRRGSYLAVAANDFTDRGSQFGFQRLDYDAIQYVPILRETWVIALHGRASAAYPKGGQSIPFFMLPSLGGGSNLRGYSSWRFRDQYSLLMQAEWRIMVNRFMETAVFYDTGKVAARASDLDFHALHDDVGFGVRLHGPFATPVRIDMAKSREGWRFVFASSAAF